MRTLLIFLVFPAMVLAGQPEQAQSPIKLPPINVNISPPAPPQAPEPKGDGWSTFTNSLVSAAGVALVTGAIGLYFHRRKKARKSAATD